MRSALEARRVHQQLESFLRDTAAHSGLDTHLQDSCLAVLHQVSGATTALDTAAGEHASVLFVSR